MQTLEAVDMCHTDTRHLFESLRPVNGQLPARQLRKIIVKGRERSDDGCPSYTVLRRPVEGHFSALAQLQKVIVKGRESSDDGCPSLATLRMCTVDRRQFGYECRIEKVVCGRNCEPVAFLLDWVREIGIEVDWLPHWD